MTGGHAPFHAHAYPVHVYCVCLLGAGKWSGVWHISKNFGACGASGKFFSKFRETLIHPKKTGQRNVFACMVHAMACEGKRMSHETS
jgi:hypothetical protein